MNAGKKLLFLLPSLAGGGAERLVQTLSTQMVRLGHQVIILTLEDPAVAYSFPAQVKILPLWTRYLNKGVFKLLALPIIALELRIRLKLVRPDAWMSLLYRANFVALLAKTLYGYKGRVVISDHTDVTGCYSARPLHGRIIRFLISKLYRKADVVVTVSEGVAQSLWSIGVPKQILTTIHNAVDIQKIKTEASSAQPSFSFVSVGRLCPDKDFAALLYAFDVVRKSHPSLRLLIVGEGPERPALTQIIDNLNLSGSVELCGWQEKPYTVVGRALAFVLSSSFEGFGLVLVEAMACGLPVISTDCRSGPSEILEGGKCGLLVPPGDSSALAAAMMRLVEDSSLRHGLRLAGLERCEKFDVETVCEEYLKLLLLTSPAADVLVATSQVSTNRFD